MAGHHVSTAPASTAVDAYLDDVARRLRGPRRRRDQIIAELSDGLEHAIDHHAAGGLPNHAAVQAAIAEFGTPQQVSAAFTGELATAYARQTIAWFIATGPLIGIWWLLLLRPQPWRTGVLALLVAIPVLPIVAVVIATAAGTFATTGRLIRWLPETGPRCALTATTVIAALVLAADTTIISLYATTRSVVRVLAVVAIAASLTRIICSLMTLRSAHLMRRHLTTPTLTESGHSHA
jgi:HAAS